MGGDVTIRSALDFGSEFTLTLRARPTERRIETTEELPQITSTDILRGRRILLVDDNLVNRRVARLFLDPLDVHITEAQNGLEAIHHLEKATFDLVLLDVHMPVMDGRECIRHIRTSQEAWSAVPVIALTADAMSGDREKYLALGMSGYAAKPINQNDLFGEMARVMAAATPVRAEPAPAAPTLPEPVEAGVRHQLQEASFEQLREAWIECVEQQFDRLLALLRDDAADAVSAEDIFRAAHDCKAQARMFDFELMGEIASDLCEALRGHGTSLTQEQRRMATAHVGSLAHIITRRLEGDGGTEGEAIRLRLIA
jgi:CheY-like chemotaxis protein